MSERTEFIRFPEHRSVQHRDGAETRRAHWGYREVLGLMAVGVLAQVLSVVLGVMVAERFWASSPEEARNLVGSEPLLAVAVQLLGWLPVLAYIVLIVRHRYGIPLHPGLAWTRPADSALKYVRLGALLALGSLVASMAVGDPDQPSPMQELFANRETLWILALFGVLVAPVLEELAFRGFLFAAFEHAHGPWVALILTSGIFASLHGAQYGWQWPQLTVLVVVGAVFGLVRIRSGSCQASTIVHATYNALLFLAIVSAREQLG